MTPRSSNRAARPTPKHKQAGQEHQGLGQVHPVLTAAQATAPRPSACRRARCGYPGRNRQGWPSSQPHRRWIVFTLGPPQPQPARLGKPFDQPCLVLAKHEAANAAQVAALARPGLAGALAGSVLMPLPAAPLAVECRGRGLRHDELRRAGQYKAVFRVVLDVGRAWGIPPGT